MQKNSSDPVVIIAFLQQLKRTDFKVYLFVMGFLLLQLFLTFVKLEVTPFLLYGRFSELTPATDTFSRIRIFINDKPLADYHPSLRERYLLETTTENYLQMKNNQHTDILKTRIEKRYPFVYNSRLYPFIKDRIYNSGEAQDQFRIWLKQKCLNIACSTDGSVRVVQTVYLMNKTTLQLNPIKNDILDDL